jgi:hypothetical protein
VTQIFHNGLPSHGGDRNIFQVMTSTLPKGTLGSVASLLAATLYQGNPDRFICSNIPAAHAYGVYLSQMMGYSRACDSYQDFLDRGLLLTRKLLNQGFLLVLIYLQTR